MSQLRLNRSMCRRAVQTAFNVESGTCLEILQSLPQAILLLDAELRIAFATRGAASLFATSSDRLTGRAITALVPHPNLDVLLGDLSDRPRVIEVSVTTPSGRRAELRLKINAVRLLTARRGELKLLTIENISETAELELLLVETEKHAAMAQLAAGILHEVANPLTSLGSNLIYVRSALTASDNPEISMALDVSLEQLDQMRQLLGTLSGLPRRPAPRYECTDLHELVRRCVTFVAKDAERRHVGLGVRFAGTAVRCEIDARLIKQVL